MTALHPPRSLKQLLLPSLLSLLLAYSAALNAILLSRPCRPPIDPSGYLCAPNGAPPDVARRRGCEFDPMSFHWYPRDQVLDGANQALLRAFLDSGPWHRYYDAAGTVEVDPGQEALTALWLTRREHMQHCVYTLRQTHLWMEKGWDSPFNYSHTVHCTGYLAGVIMEHPPPDLEDVNVQAVPYPKEWQVVKPKYPCEKEGLSCVSW